MKRIIKPDRLDKIVGLILVVGVGISLVLALLWFMAQFFMGFLDGFISAF